MLYGLSGASSSREIDGDVLVGLELTCVPIYLIADAHADTCVNFTPSWNASPSSSKGTTAHHGW